MSGNTATRHRRLTGEELSFVDGDDVHLVKAAAANLRELGRADGLQGLLFVRRRAVLAVTRVVLVLDHLCASRPVHEHSS